MSSACRLVGKGYRSTLRISPSVSLTVPATAALCPRLGTAQQRPRVAITGRRTCEGAPRRARHLCRSAPPPTGRPSMLGLRAGWPQTPWGRSPRDASARDAVTVDTLRRKPRLAHSRAWLAGEVLSLASAVSSQTEAAVHCPPSLSNPLPNRRRRRFAPSPWRRGQRVVGIGGRRRAT